MEKVAKWQPIATASASAELELSIYDKGEYHALAFPSRREGSAGAFVAEERGPYELKGVPEPVTLFRIVRASAGVAVITAIP